MTFTPGSKKPEKSGRKAGTPNKRTQTVIELVESSGKNPITVMLDLLDDEDPALRLAAAKELAQYLFPKRKAENALGESNDTPLVGIAVTDEQLTHMVMVARGMKVPG